jgi:hypothetical protein
MPDQPYEKPVNGSQKELTTPQKIEGLFFYQYSGNTGFV